VLYVHIYFLFLFFSFYFTIIHFHISHDINLLIFYTVDDIHLPYLFTWFCVFLVRLLVCSICNCYFELIFADVEILGKRTKNFSHQAMVNIRKNITNSKWSVSNWISRFKSSNSTSNLSTSKKVWWNRFCRRCTTKWKTVSS